MKQFGVDRFEENIGVLVDMDGLAIDVEKALLPDGVKEGDILFYDGEKYLLQSELTDERRAETRRLIDELFD